ncbi:hypothetical protein BDK51DRAFT_43536 [Blyttiomyces helicus]|uniref:Uncharacterized protein n=1 Tax=Blyttiomyces helicus TaxID=388810 RepID=A0A4P9WC17_9FUNG|nr:hypothetical protein BDK51DRAFT_43536 [Blyttiomyces helicus]|eukprot:RKO90044.1 hypothetical protein BDK51DRAFT_43536 [Blyttiomyces helicus]
MNVCSAIQTPFIFSQDLKTLRSVASNGLQALPLRVLADFRLPTSVARRKLNTREPASRPASWTGCRCRRVADPCATLYPPSSAPKKTRIPIPEREAPLAPEALNACHQIPQSSKHPSDESACIKPVQRVPPGETDTEEVPGLVSDDDEYEASDGHEGDEDEDEDEDDDEDNDDDSSDSGDGGDGNDEIPGLASDSDGGPPGLVSDDESPRGLEGDSDSGPPGLVSYESGSESGPLGLLSDDSEAEAEADNGPPGLVSDDAWETDDGPPGLVSDRDDDEDDAPSFKKTPVPNSKLTTAPKSKSANGSKAGEPINAKVVKESAAASRERETGGPAAPHKPPVRGSGHMISQPLPPPTKSAQPPAASTRGSASGTRGSTSASATGRSTFGAAAPQRPPAPAPTPAATDVPAAEDMPDLVSDSDDDLAPVGTGAWARQMASNRGGARKGR